MLKVEGFQQRDPKDGAPISQKTEAYLGYTDKNLYVCRHLLRYGATQHSGRVFPAAN